MSDLPAVPDYFGQFMAPLQRQQQIGIDQQNANAQSQQLAFEVAKQRAALVRQQQFAQDSGSVVANPTPEGFRALLLKYPEEHEGLKAAWDNYSDAEKQRDIGGAASLYAAIANGQPDLATTLLKDRETAQKNAGVDDPVTQHLLDLVSSGDPAKIKQAQGLAGFALATSAGPDKIGPMLEALNKGHDSYTLAPGDIRFDENGGIVAQSPYIKAADGTLYERDTGATASTNAATAATGGAKSSIDHVLGNEGGYNPKDLNGSPTNFGINFSANKSELAKMGITAANFKGMSKNQAEQLYMEKYWPQSGADKLPANLQAPYFDVYVRSPKAAQRALAQSGGDPQRFMQIASGYFTSLAKRDPNAAFYAKAWANRDAGNTAIATGATSPPVGASTPANAPPGYHVLIPGAPKGLPTGYEPDPAKPGAIRPIPGGPNDTNSDEVLSRYNIAPNETGPSVLAKLPANIASQVKGLAEGRLAMPSSFALAKPYWQQMLQLTAQYDPAFDAANAPARKAAITAFTGTGKGAMLVGSINRVANHLDTLWSANQQLAGPDLKWGPLSSLAAGVGQSFEKPQAAAYDGALQFVAGELGKLAKAGLVTEGETNRIISNMDRKNAETTRESAIQTAVKIISGAVDPLKDQYNSAFTNGSTRPNIPWVTPKAQQIFSKIGGVDLSLTGAGADTNAPASGGSRQPPAGATKTATGPNGQKAALVNGRWVTY